MLIKYKKCMLYEKLTFIFLIKEEEKEMKDIQGVS